MRRVDTFYKTLSRVSEIKIIDPKVSETKLNKKTILRDKRPF